MPRLIRSLFGMLVLLVLGCRVASAQVYNPITNCYEDTAGLTAFCPHAGAANAPAPPPKPDVWGALAVSPSTLISGTSWNYKTEAAARDAALAPCRSRGGTDCKVVVTVADVCVAIAVSNAEKVYAIGGPTGAGNFADDAALAKCKRAGGKSCFVQASFCADGERHQLNGHTELANGNPIFVPGGSGGAAHALPVPGDDTARFYGTWTTSFPVNGQTVTMKTMHDARGYHNAFVTPTGDVPAGDGTFSAAHGRYNTNAVRPNDSGTYHFIDNKTVVCTNAAGQTVTWTRIGQAVDANAAAAALTNYRPPAERPGNFRKR